MSEFLTVDQIMRDDMLRDYFTTNPKNVDPASTAYTYYVDTLFRKAQSVYKFNGMPDNWDYDYFTTVLLGDGLIAITDTAMGVLPLKCGFSGINVFNHPTRIIIANPILGNLEREIDSDGILVKMNYNYRSPIMPIVYKYATMLADCDGSIAVNLQNSKVAFIGFCTSKQQAQSMKLMYDEISKGSPAVFVKGDQINAEQIYYNHVKENFIAGEVQILKRKIMSEFLTEIGINNANTDKKERLITDEANANNNEIQLNAGYWLDNIKEGLDKANNMFGLNLSVELKNTYNTEEGVENVDIRTAL